MPSAEKITGIDLGTAQSLVAVTSSGEPKIIFNRDGEPATPNVVSFAEGGEVLVGANALILHNATRSNRQLQPMPATQPAKSTSCSGAPSRRRLQALPHSLLIPAWKMSLQPDVRRRA